MTSSIRLGGFKILKDVVRVPLSFPTEKGASLTNLFQLLAQEKINLPYITCIREQRAWNVDIIVDMNDESRVSQVLEKAQTGLLSWRHKSAILSIFPHRNNPTVPGVLFEVFGQKGLVTDSFAHSPSAISVVVREELLNKASNALFGPFCFSAYRTPADWKLTQKGKEELYKEVVASYQEKRPKIYGLECREGEELLRLTMNSRHLTNMGMALKELAKQGLSLSFLILNHPNDTGESHIFFCLPQSEHQDYGTKIRQLIPKVNTEAVIPVAVFSMNGPHFGDRYGIASELLNALKEVGADLLALSCSIASITGVISLDQIELAIHAIQGYFEVPCVIKKGCDEK